MRIVFAIVLSVMISGCSGQSHKAQSYGNFAQVDSVGLVQDAMTMLTALYPPAQTRLQMVQDTSDPFGAALVENLRANGYAVLEDARPSRGDKYAEFAAKPDGAAFGYLVDRMGTDDEIRITLNIGAESVSRLYRVQEHANGPNYLPAGHWVRRQG